MLPLCGRPFRLAGQYGRRAHLTQNDHLTAAVAQSPGISSTPSLLGLGELFSGEMKQGNLENRRTWLLSAPRRRPNLPAPSPGVDPERLSSQPTSRQEDRILLYSCFRK